MDDVRIAIDQHNAGGDQIERGLERADCHLLHVERIADRNRAPDMRRQQPEDRNVALGNDAVALMA